MIKKMFGVFASILAGLAVVGVAWAGSDDGVSTSTQAATESSASVSTDDDTSLRAASAADTSTSASVKASPASVEASAGAETKADVRSSTSSSTSTSIKGATSTSVVSTTSTSTDSSTSTTFDDRDKRQLPDEVSTHILPGVGSVTVEVSAGQLVLVSVTAPGWTVEREKIKPDRIELELTSGLRAEAEFKARINNGEVEIRIEVDLG